MAKSAPHLPLPDVLHPLAEGPLQAGAELQGVAADLHNVVDEGAHGGQRERRGEEDHVAELNEHLLVVLEGSLFGSDIGKVNSCSS